jgi:hypothetical protein
LLSRRPGSFADTADIQPSSVPVAQMPPLDRN